MSADQPQEEKNKQAKNVFKHFLVIIINIICKVFDVVSLFNHFRLKKKSMYCPFCENGQGFQGLSVNVGEFKITYEAESHSILICQLSYLPFYWVEKALWAYLGGSIYSQVI